MLRKYKLTEDEIICMLQKFLKDLGKNIEKNINEINRGGCCVYAAYLAQKIKRNFPFLNVWLVVCDLCAEPHNVHTARRNLRLKGIKQTVFNWEREGIIFGHVLVKIKYKNIKLLVDTSRVIPYTKIIERYGCGYKMYGGHLTINEGLCLAKISREWNHAFDRRQIPQLKNILKDEMKSFLRNSILK